VLLEVAGDGVEVSGTSMRRQLRPAAKGFSRTLNGVVAVILVTLDSFAQNFTSRGILRLVKGTALRLVPLVVDEVAK
jgi:hypothetical protein